MGWAAEMGMICCGKARSAGFVGSSRGQIARSKRSGVVGTGEPRARERTAERRRIIDIVELMSADLSESGTAS